MTTYDPSVSMARQEVETGETPRSLWASYPDQLSGEQEILPQSRWKVRINIQGHPLTSTRALYTTYEHACMWEHTNIHTHTHKVGRGKLNKCQGYSKYVYLYYVT